MNGFKDREVGRTRESVESSREAARIAIDKLNNFKATLSTAKDKLEGLKVSADKNLQKKINKTLKKIEVTLTLARAIEENVGKTSGEKIEKFISSNAGFTRRIESQLNVLTGILAKDGEGQNNKEEESVLEVKKNTDLTGSTVPLLAKEEEVSLALNFDEKAGKELNTFLKDVGVFVDFPYPKYLKDGTMYKFLEFSGKQEPGVIKSDVKGEFIISLTDGGKSLNIQLKRKDGSAAFMGPIKVGEGLGRRVFEAMKPIFRENFIRQMEETNYNVSGNQYFLGRKINVNGGGIYPLVKKLKDGGTVDFAAIQVEVWKNGMKLKVLAKDSDATLEQVILNDKITHPNDLSDALHSLISNFVKGKSIEKSAVAANESEGK